MQKKRIAVAVFFAAFWLLGLLTAADYGLVVAQLWLLARGAERETLQTLATHTDAP